jgi:hypothetical protein
MKSSCQCKTSTLQGSSTLRVLKLNHSLAMEHKSTQDTTKRVKWILNAKYQKADLRSIIRNNCRHLSADQQKKSLQLLQKYELLFDGTLGDWKTKPVSFQLKGGGITLPWPSFPSAKNPQRYHHERGGEIVQTGGIREAACI